MKHSKRRELKTTYQGTAGLSVIYSSAVTWLYSFLYLKQKKISLEESICANSYCLLERIRTLKKQPQMFDTYTAYPLTVK